LSMGRATKRTRRESWCMIMNLSKIAAPTLDTTSAGAKLGGHMPFSIMPFRELMIWVKLAKSYSGDENRNLET
jgi:hypothetical protein